MTVPGERWIVETAALAASTRMMVAQFDLARAITDHGRQSSEAGDAAVRLADAQRHLADANRTVVRCAIDSRAERS